MAEARMSLPVVRGFGETSRRDRWWVQPLVVFLVLSAFIVYATWAAFQGDALHVRAITCRRSTRRSCSATRRTAWFGPKPAWWPAWLLFSPALLILWAPGGFRFTCYYYRGAYYKAFWADPPACAVGEPRKGYWGERTLPLILQNIHRYFLYIALLFLVLLAYDATRRSGSRRRDGNVLRHRRRHASCWPLNVVLLGGYTFGCHSLAAPGRRLHRPAVAVAGAAQGLRLRRVA